jgi:hypothetical protein
MPAALVQHIAPESLKLQAQLLLDQERDADVRRLLAQHPDLVSQDKGLAGLARLLGPLRGSSCTDETQATPTLRNFRWIEEHTGVAPYAGTWVALYDGRVLAQGRTRLEMLTNLQAHPDRDKATAWRA